MHQKSPEAFRTISEVADILDVPQHVLRFWESKFRQIKPLKRSGSRRYYRPEDVDLLRGVQLLLYDEGYTIKGVQKIFKEQGVRFVINTGQGKARTRLGEAAEDGETANDSKRTPVFAQPPLAGERSEQSPFGIPGASIRAALEAIVERLEKTGRALAGENPGKDD